MQALDLYAHEVALRLSWKWHTPQLFHEYLPVLEFIILATGYGLRWDTHETQFLQRFFIITKMLILFMDSKANPRNWLCVINHLPLQNSGSRGFQSKIYQH